MYGLITRKRSLEQQHIMQLLLRGKLNQHQVHPRVLDLEHAEIQDNVFLSSNSFQNIVHFQHAKIQNSQFTKWLFFKHVDFTKTYIFASSFRLCEFQDADFTDAHIQHSNFIQCRMNQCNFNNAIITDCGFYVARNDGSVDDKFYKDDYTLNLYSSKKLGYRPWFGKDVNFQNATMTNIYIDDLDIDHETSHINFQDATLTNVCFGHLRRTIYDYLKTVLTEEQRQNIRVGVKSSKYIYNQDTGISFNSYGDPLQDEDIRENLYQYEFQQVLTRQKTVVVLITTHGSIDIKENIPIAQELPKTMFMSYLHSTAPGCVNYMFESNAIVFFSKLYEIVSASNMDSDDVVTFVETQILPVWEDFMETNTDDIIRSVWSTPQHSGQKKHQSPHICLTSFLFNSFPQIDATKHKILAARD